MKSFQAALLTAVFGLATAAPGAAPAVTSSASLTQATPLVTGSAPHTADHAPAVNPGYTPSQEQIDEAATSKKCITFTSENDDWYYTNSAPWSGTGTFGSTGGKICVPYSDKAGGAMYIGPYHNPGPGNTKLECYFPSAGTANCDVSLVDGYSLSVTCTADGMKAGGSADLWTTGETCSDNSEEQYGICLNSEGYASSQSDVTPFFQKGVQNGNQYCIWVNCSEDYYFPVTDAISCHVSGTAMT